MKRLLTVALALLLTMCAVSPAFAQSADPVTLTYWDMMWGQADVYPGMVSDLIETYEQSNGGAIKIDVQMIPWDNFYQVFLTAIASGTAPDFSTGAFPQAVQYAAMGEILYLDDIVEQWKNENNPIYTDMIKGSIELHKYDGHYAGIPWSADPRQIMFRQDAFDQAGITEMPKTYDEFLDVCRAIKEKTDFIPFAFCPSDYGGTHVMLNFLVGNGAGILDANGEPMFESEQAMQVLEFFKTLYDEQLVPDGVVSYTNSDLEKLMATGKLAMAFTGPPSYLASVPEVEQQVHILSPLAGPSGTAQNFTWMASIMGYKQTEHPEEVKATIKWWLENDIDLWSVENAISPLPVRLSYYTNPLFKPSRITAEIGELNMPSAVSPVWPYESLYTEFAQIEGENYLGLALQDIMQGKGDLQAIAKQTNDKLKVAFEE